MLRGLTLDSLHSGPRSVLRQDSPNPTLKAVVALLKLGDWDPDVFYKFRDTVLNQARGYIYINIPCVCMYIAQFIFSCMCVCVYQAPPPPHHHPAHHITHIHTQSHAGADLRPEAAQRPLPRHPARVGELLPPRPGQGMYVYICV